MDIKELLSGAIREAAEKAAEEGAFVLNEMPAVMLEVPPQKEFGDYATNFAMQTANAAKVNPRIVAQSIVDRLKQPWLKKAEIA